jgi:UDP-glucose 4-epimerase
VVNLGTGKGTSVLELIAAFEKASGKTIPYEVVERRPGDLASVYAKTELARELLDWTAVHDINRMCQDSWRWQSLNPNGLETSY